jgi:hypothetical protein
MKRSTTCGPAAIAIPRRPPLGGPRLVRSRIVRAAAANIGIIVRRMDEVEIGAAAGMSAPHGQGHLVVRETMAAAMPPMRWAMGWGVDPTWARPCDRLSGESLRAMVEWSLGDPLSIVFEIPSRWSCSVMTSHQILALKGGSSLPLYFAVFSIWNGGVSKKKACFGTSVSIQLHRTPHELSPTVYPDGLHTWPNYGMSLRAVCIFSCHQGGFDLERISQVPIMTSHPVGQETSIPMPCRRSSRRSCGNVSRTLSPGPAAAYSAA